MSDALDIARLLDDVAARLGGPEALDEKLRRITQAAKENLPGVDFASISILQHDGSLTTAAATDEVIDQADHWQYRLHEGPCFAAVTNEEVFVTEDVGSDDRWPEYGPIAKMLGLKAQAAVPLYRHRGTRGALNLYSASADTFSDPDHLIDIFAHQASLMLGHASEVHSLRRANCTRKVIGQALGIVMERYCINEDRAFEHLIRVSQTGNIKLRDVAEDLVRLSNGPTD